MSALMVRGDGVVDDLPSYVWVLVFVGVIGMPAVTAGALYRGGLAAGLGRRTAATVSVVAGGVWGLWIVGAAALAGAGLYREEPGALNPWIGVVFALVLAALLSATRIPVVARILAEPGTPGRLAWPHTLRVVGAVFLVVLALGELPAVFAVPAGLGDIAVGVAAVFVARRWAGGRPGRPAVWFNVLGVVDLAVAVGIGFLAGLGPSPVLDVNPSTDNLAALPLVLIPTTAVPLAIALHLVSLRRLAVAARASHTAAHRSVATTA
jgi:hypothetical protein